MEERIRFIKKQDNNCEKQHTHELQNTEITKELDENILQQTAHPHITQPIDSNNTTNTIAQHIIKLILKRTDKYIQAGQSAKVHFVDQTFKALINRENIVISDQIYPPHAQSRLECDKQPRGSNIFFEGTGQAKLYFEIKKKDLISQHMQPPPKLMNKSSHRSNKIIEAAKKSSKNRVDTKQENKKQSQNKEKTSTNKSSNKQKITKLVSIEDPKMNPHLIQLDSNKKQAQNDNFINYLREIKNEGKIKERKQSITINKNDKMIEAGLSTSLIKSTKECLYQTKSICSQNSKMAKRDRLQKSNAFGLENFYCQVSQEKIGYNAYSYDKVDHKMNSQNSLKKKEKQMTSIRKIKNRISTKDTVECKQNIYLPIIEEKKSPRRSSVKMLDQMTKWHSKQHFQNYKTKLGEYLNSESILPSVIVRRTTHGGEQKPRDLFDGVKQEVGLVKQRCIDHDIE